MNCPSSITAESVGSISAGLQLVDCMSADATASAFDRLFGVDGGLGPALTLALTLYVSLLAIGLLTGRATLGLGSLTPRLMTLGLVLTFATSWLAYRNIVWTLLTRGPDEIAAAVLGIKGSASQAFAQRLDQVFAMVADVAEQAQAAAGQNMAGKNQGATPGDMLSYAALLLLLGTAGVLVTARIALASLLAVGPVFIVLGLFPGTRGLCEGWLKAAVMAALVPLFVVLLGAGSLGMIGPVAASLDGGVISMRVALMVFVIAAVHCALMGLAIRTVTVMVSGWQIRLGPVEARCRPDGAVATAGLARSPDGLPAPPGTGARLQSGASAPAADPRHDDRIRAIVAAAGRFTAAGPVAAPNLAPAPAWSRGGPSASLPSARASEIARGLTPAPPVMPGRRAKRGPSV